MKPASWINPEAARSGVTGHSLKMGSTSLTREWGLENFLISPAAKRLPSLRWIEGRMVDWLIGYFVRRKVPAFFSRETIRVPCCLGEELSITHRFSPGTLLLRRPGARRRAQKQYFNLRTTR